MAASSVTLHDWLINFNQTPPTFIGRWSRLWKSWKLLTGTDSAPMPVVTKN